jgi:hypothetical protein
MVVSAMPGVLPPRRGARRRCGRYGGLAEDADEVGPAFDPREIDEGFDQGDVEPAVGGPFRQGDTGVG